MADLVEFEQRGAVGVMTINNPPVNALGAGVRQGIAAALERGTATPEIKALVLTGHGRIFSGGADIREFATLPKHDAPHLRQVIERIEGSAKPVIAAINGTAAGGGLEIALGCHYRLAAPAARLGQPEVKLGIVPGAGGTQRLPRLIGVEPALELVVGGDLVPAAMALELGLIDEVIEDGLVDRAVGFAEQVAAEGRPPRRARGMEDKLAVARGRPQLFQDFRKAMARRARGFEAPYACVDCVEAALAMPFEEAMAKEREIFQRCVTSDQSKALRHMFFAEREAAKIPDLPADTPARPIERAAVIGAGTMGGGIAMNFANAGIPVSVLELSREVLDKGLGIVRKNYAATVSKGRLTQPEMDRRLGLITGVLDYDAVADADFVIEAVFEDMQVKKEVFRTLDRAVKPEAILATNTSSLDVNQIAAVTGRPEAVIGTHFFSPANVMRLMEIVCGDKSSPETIATTMKLAKTLGKVGVLVGVCDGFVGNRMLYAYTRQANFLLEEGALPQQVDQVIYDFGFPMGPFAMGDLAGLDVGWRIRKRRAATRPQNLRYSPIADRICERGRFGQKTGAGWYRYEAGSRTPIPDPEIEALILEVSRELGIERRQIDDQEILERCLYPLINEGAQILDE
ncbi:MAG: 3-hydroxyacyl-CoA dehydrogenase NAD-binding domain-containing protein, partial [Kiloniellales bacterium]